MLASVKSEVLRLLECALASWVRMTRSEHPCPNCGWMLDRKLRCDMGCGRRWCIITNEDGDVIRWQEVGR